MNNFTLQSADKPLEGYTIERPVGHGGFGEVYHARSDAGKDVALKLVQRFLEIELRGVGHCLNLKHPNLVTIYDVRPDAAGRQWIIMEYVAGRNLSEVLEEHPEGMPQDEALRWFEAICQGVDHLHTSGIVHRDLKPANVFDDAGTVKVGDYGLSKFITASKRSAQTQSVGTVHYMAPEVGSGRYGREVDVYAVGVMLYEMLTGKVPYDGETPAEILMKHLTATPDLKVLPPVFQGLVARMLAKNPNDRYSSLAAAWSDLKVRLADAAHAEAAGEVSQYPAYDEAIVSRRGASDWLEAPFAFLKNLGQGGEAAPPARPALPMAAHDPPWPGIIDRLRERPFLLGFCVFVTALLIMLSAASRGPGGPREADVFKVVFVSLAASVVVVAWAHLFSRGSQASRSRWRAHGGWSDRQQRPGVPPGDDPNADRGGPVHSAHAPPRDSDAPVHMGATEVHVAGPDRPHDLRPAPYPRERREAIGSELTQFRHWQYAIGGLFMALCLGAGVGLTMAGVSYLLFDGQRADEEIATFLGVGSGFFAAGWILSWRLGSWRGPLLMRALIPLMVGGGVGLSVAGLFIAMFGWDGEDLAVLAGVAAGFLTAAALAWKLQLAVQRSAFVRIGTALFLGAGVGAMAGAMAAGVWHGPHDEEIHLFTGLGVGFLTTGVFLCRLITARESFVGLRLLASLFCGGGAGCLAAATAAVMEFNDDVWGFLGAGVGFLTCGIVAYNLFAAGDDRRVRSRW